MSDYYYDSENEDNLNYAALDSESNYRKKEQTDRKHGYRGQNGDEEDQRPTTKSLKDDSENDDSKKQSEKTKSPTCCSNFIEFLKELYQEYPKTVIATGIFFCLCLCTMIFAVISDAAKSNDGIISNDSDSEEDDDFEPVEMISLPQNSKAKKANKLQDSEAKDEKQKKAKKSHKVLGVVYNYYGRLDINSTTFRVKPYKHFLLDNVQDNEVFHLNMLDPKGYTCLINNTKSPFQKLILKKTLLIIKCEKNIPEPEIKTSPENGCQTSIYLTGYTGEIEMMFDEESISHKFTNAAERFRKEKLLSGKHTLEITNPAGYDCEILTPREIQYNEKLPFAAVYREFVFHRNTASNTLIIQCKKKYKKPDDKTIDINPRLLHRQNKQAEAFEIYREKGEVEDYSPPAELFTTLDILDEKFAANSLVMELEKENEVEE